MDKKSDFKMRVKRVKRLIFLCPSGASLAYRRPIADEELSNNSAQWDSVNFFSLDSLFHGYVFIGGA